MGKIIFFGGKGGVGKTSCSTAYALAQAKNGHKTLLVSTDPAHSISDLFDSTIGSEISFLKENLFGIEIDPNVESKLYIEKIRGNLRTILSPIIMEELNQQLDAASISPGSHESALFDKMIELIIDPMNTFDKIVFDTAPTGHTIRLLSLPELLGAWIDSLLKKRKKTLSLRNMIGRERKKEDPIIEILSRRKENLTKARSIMVGGDELEFVFVLNAEKMPIEETKKAVSTLKKYNMNVSTIVINKVLPDFMHDDFWKVKKIKEEQYIEEIKRDIKAKLFYQIPLFQEDMDENTIYQMAKIFY